MSRDVTTLPRRGRPSVDRAHFFHRVIQDAMVDAAAAQWRHRADVFDWAAPRAGDYLGQATNDDRAAQAVRCAGTAQACRARAAFIEAHPAGTAHEADQALNSIAHGDAA